MRDFDAWLTEVSKAEPFRVGGQEFTPRVKITHRKLQQVFDARRKILANPESSEEALLHVNDDFFRAALRKGDGDRFVELLHNENDDDEDSLITSRQVNEVIDFLIEILTGQSAPKDEPSTPGPRTTGASSKPESFGAEDEGGEDNLV